MQFGLTLKLLWCGLRRHLVVVQVGGDSMLPALQAGDLLFCSRGGKPKVGAVVLDEQPLPTGQVARHIKRISGLAGDMRGGARVPPGCVWLEGDNPIASTDSRQWGPVALERLRGVGFAVLRSDQLIDLRPPTRRTRVNLRAQLFEIWDDLANGVRTRGAVSSDDFGFSPAAVHAYVPTPWSLARRALDVIEVSPDDVFLDYGCGRGRVLVVALHYPFRRVIGVELIPALAKDARRNVARHRTRSQVIEGDAATSPLSDEVTVIYMFNAFGSDTLNDVLSRIRESISRRPRAIRVLTYAMDPNRLRTALGVAPRDLGDGMALYTLNSTGDKDGFSIPSLQ